MTLIRSKWMIALGLLLILAVAPIVFYYTSPFQTPVEEPAAPTMESLIRIKHTHYPIPEGAVFVATDGIDNAGCGAQEHPCRSIRFTALKAFNESTLVIRGGTYHEYIEFNKKLTLQPYPDEEVWIDGSQPVTGWVQDGTIWRHDNWQFLWNGEDGKPIGETIEPQFLDLDYPMSAWPDMVFRNGENLQQVGSRNEVIPGSFFVDYDNSTLFVGDDPAANTLEAAMFPIAMQIYENGNGTIIRGIGFRRYANPIRGGLGAMVHLHASDMIIENNTFAQSASSAFALNFSKNTIVRGNIFVANGSVGSGGYKTDGLLFEGNYLAYNNSEHFAYDWESGGAKMTGIRNATIRGNIFEHNWGTGFWCDISCLNVDVVQNTFRNNDYNGVTYEISTNTIVASNLVVGNKQNGIMISGSSDATVVNNTLVRNRRNIGVTDDARKNTDATEISEGNTWDTRSVEIYNNLLFDNDGTDTNRDNGSNFVMISNYAGDDQGDATGASMIDVLDYNAYFRTVTSQPESLLSLWTGAQGHPRFWKYFSDLAAIQQSANGYEAHGIGNDQAAAESWFVDAAKDDYRLAANAIVQGKGKPLDAATSVVINGGLAQPVVMPQDPVDIGALVWADFDVTSDTWSLPGE